MYNNQLQQGGFQPLLNHNPNLMFPQQHNRNNQQQIFMNKKTTKKHKSLLRHSDLFCVFNTVYFIWTIATTIWLIFSFATSQYLGFAPRQYNNEGSDYWDYDAGPDLLVLGIFDLIRQLLLCTFDILACVYIYYAICKKQSDISEKVVSLLKGGTLFHLSLNILVLLSMGVCSFVADDCDPFMNMFYYGIPIWAMLWIFGIFLVIGLSVLCCSFSYLFSWRFATVNQSFESSLNDQINEDRNRNVIEMQNRVEVGQPVVNNAQQNNRVVN